MTRSAAIASALLVALAASPAVAHPHVWIDARADFIFDRSGRLSALGIRWTFDEMYSVFTVRGLDKNRDGRLNSDEIAPLIDGMMASLKSYDYFTFMRADGKTIAFGAPVEAGATFENSTLVFRFTLPLTESIDARDSDVLFAMYDPSIYVAIEIANNQSLRLVGVPPVDCSSRIVENRPEIESKSLAEVLVQDLDNSGGGFPDYAQRVKISCPASGEKG